MSAQSVIRAGRLAAQVQMTLTLTAYSPTGSYTTDANGYDVLAFTSQGSTPGKIQGDPDPEARRIVVGDVSRPVLAAGLHIPITSLVPVAGEQRGKGWEFVVTAVGAADDPALLGRRYLVVDVPAKSKATARRLDVVEV